MQLRALLSEFGADVTSRGREYARSGAVTLIASPKGSIVAKVTGTKSYDVLIEVDQGRLFLSCTCPYFASSGPCKHLAATAIVADGAGKLAAFPSDLEIALDESLAEHLDDDDDDFNDDDLDDEIPPREVFNRPRTSTPLPLASAAKEKAKPSASPSVAIAKTTPVSKSTPVAKPAPPAAPSPPPPPSWKTVLERAEAASDAMLAPPRAAQSRELYFVLDPSVIARTGKFTLVTLERVMRRDGVWSRIQPARLAPEDLDEISDRRLQSFVALVQSVVGARDTQRGYYGRPWQRAADLDLDAELALTILPLAAATGRLFAQTANAPDLLPLRYDDGPQWEFTVSIARDEATTAIHLRGSLRRAGEVLDLGSPLVLHVNGWIVTREVVARLEHYGAFELIAALRAQPTIAIPGSDETAFLERLLALRTLPRLDIAPSLRLEEITIAPRPVLRISPAKRAFSTRNNQLEARLAFAYGDELVRRNDRRTVLARVRDGKLVRRDLAFEDRASARLGELGFRMATGLYNPNEDIVDERFELTPKRLPFVVRALVHEGWQVEAEGKLYRRPRDFDLTVTSGVDWFELSASIDFEGVGASLPELLEAIRSGDGMVRLGDGTFGILPEAWLTKHAMLAQFAPKDRGSAVRFRKNQVWLLDALLAGDSTVRADDPFVRAREEIQKFDGVAAEKPSRSFRGTLRAYQSAGLGWFSFLRRFGFGGCLADDMGLGKTVQVLAMLDARRSEAKKKPSLVVVPKSVVWNWREEAKRFAPKLDVWVHTGHDRIGNPREFAQQDLVITTYGTLRRDIEMMSQVEFDYVILDEAQAIKNAQSDSARAACRLRADHRLALSGTPVENHLGELWSIFEFLNPGMLGVARAFQDARGSTRPSQETAAILSRALKPFVLRRTKEQVAPDLPAKHQETLICDLDGPQRKLYDQLRDHYRASLLGMIARDGIAKSKIHVLEALLRLRQAACHVGLVDQRRVRESSAKLEVIVARLLEVREEGHKALVFSQFTSFLAIVRARLEAEGVAYEYLDGGTVDREARVNRFQTDRDCPVFLISLKAGGVGLNLTAADYIFILDPWWNPAVEAQAIDRAHRIGQTKHVFVYRLICRDTVEEKVAALQETKRGLADSIIHADESLLRGLDRETLEALLE